MKKMFLYTTAFLTSFACSNAYAEKCQTITTDGASFEYCYDENDKIIAITYYDKDGNIPDYSKYSYLPDNEMHSSVHAYSSDDREFPSRLGENDVLSLNLESLKITNYATTFPSTIAQYNPSSSSYNYEKKPVHTEYVYDASGNLTSQYSYDYNSDLSSFSIANLDKYTYDSNGNIASYISYNYDENNLAHIDLEEIYKYNGNGTLKLIDSYAYYGSYESPEYKRYSYAYDDGGRLTEQSIYAYNNLSSLPELSSMYTYDYNENGKISNLRLYDYNQGNDESLVFGENYSYDTNGNLTSQQVYSGDLENGGKLENEYVYEYDTNGNLTEQLNYSYNPESSTPNLDRVYVYEYDEGKNLISFVEYDGDPEKLGRVVSLSNYSYSGYYDVYAPESTSRIYQYLEPNIYSSISSLNLDNAYFDNISFDSNKYQNFEYTPKSEDIAVKPQRTHYTTEEALEHIVPGDSNRITFTVK